MILQVQLWLFNLFLCGWTLEIKPKLTIDEFFNSTNFFSLSFSPSGQYLLFQAIQPIWNNSSYEYSLWLYEIDTEKKQLITKNLGKDLKPHWSSNGNSIAFFLKNYLYLYSILSNELSSIAMNIENPSMLRWSDNDTSLYVTTVSSQSFEEGIPYRQRINNVNSTIHRIDIHNQTSPIKINMIANLPFLIGEFLYVPFEEKLVFTSASILFENIDDFEIYVIDLRNGSSLSRLTYNQEFEKW
jgi:Tol biopolymer transport system component